MPDRDIHISGLVVYTQPDLLIPVRRSVERITGCEVAAEDAGGKLVLVLETGDTRRVTETIERIQSLKGVINAVLAYHHCENESALDEEIEDDINPS